MSAENPNRWNPFRHERTGNNAEQTRALTATPAEPPPFGLKVEIEGQDPIVDIIVIHGLNGHRENTWTASNGVHWPRDLLSSDIPNARILSWGYDASTHGNWTNHMFLYDHGRQLVSDLCLKRNLTQTSTRPIIFVAHSLGGIVLKSALIHADAARVMALEEQRLIKTSTYGIIFMGTPHQGGNGVALGRHLINLASVFVATNKQLIQHLEQNSEWLQQQLGQYGPISGDFVTKFAFEVYETRTVMGQSLMVVPRASAVVPGAADAESIAIHADHINMVKFSSREDGGYQTLSGQLQLMVNNATSARIVAAEREALQQALGALAPNVRHIVSGESNVNRLRIDSGSGEAVVTVPHFQPGDFLRFIRWRTSRSESSTFRLADLLELLPGQTNSDRAVFETKDLRRLGNLEDLYQTPCPSSALAAFICQHFHSLEADGDIVNIRTDVGVFTISPKVFGATLTFSLNNGSPSPHALATGDYESICNFAGGQFRLGLQAFQLLGSGGNFDDERWRRMPTRLATLTPGLDHPWCARFVMEGDLQVLESSREVCKTVMRIFIRFADEDHFQDTEAIEELDYIVESVRPFRDSNFVHPRSVSMVSEAYWAICTMACPDQVARATILETVIHNLAELLGEGQQPTPGAAEVTGIMQTLLQEHGTPFICCFAAYALLTSMNCSVLLEISVESPPVWLRLLTGHIDTVTVQ